MRHIFNNLHDDALSSCQEAEVSKAAYSDTLSLSQAGAWAATGDPDRHSTGSCCPCVHLTKQSTLLSMPSVLPGKQHPEKCL